MPFVPRRRPSGGPVPLTARRWPWPCWPWPLWPTPADPRRAAVARPSTSWRCDGRRPAAAAPAAQGRATSAAPGSSRSPCWTIGGERVLVADGRHRPAPFVLLLRLPVAITAGLLLGIGGRLRGGSARIAAESAFAGAGAGRRRRAGAARLERRPLAAGVLPGLLLVVAVCRPARRPHRGRASGPCRHAAARAGASSASTPSRSSQHLTQRPALRRRWRAGSSAATQAARDCCSACRRPRSGATLGGRGRSAAAVPRAGRQAREPPCGREIRGCGPRSASTGRAPRSPGGRVDLGAEDRPGRSRGLVVLLPGPDRASRRREAEPRGARTGWR